MVIDQRASGGSTTVSSSGGSYLSCDRWQTVSNGATSKYSIQQNAGSVTPPAGYAYYLGMTSTSAYSLAATDNFWLVQSIEGYNMSDLAFGTSSAATVTVSFWVRSSLTGTFSGVLVNSNDTQVYPFSYTISSASTWEQKTITIAGSTTGTWNSTNGQGLRLQFSLGLGTTYLGTLTNTWNAGTLYGPTGQVNLVSTNGATFYVTGVQLEKGTQATSFDYRSITTETQFCQRYFLSVSGPSLIGTSVSTSACLNKLLFPVTMRTAPAAAYSGATMSVDFFGTGVATTAFANVTLASTVTYLSLNINTLSPTRTAFVPTSIQNTISVSAEL